MKSKGGPPAGGGVRERGHPGVRVIAPAQYTIYKDAVRNHGLRKSKRKASSENCYAGTLMLGWVLRGVGGSV